MKRFILPMALAVQCVFSFASSSFGQALTPQEALKRMMVADGFEVKLVASEPQIRQPVTMMFDDRGRIWVVQYLQYPNPAGLKPVHVDQYLRTKYDRVPEPPPHGPKGADKITIIEDPDGDGVYDKAKDFVTGLNLASGMCLGHGGVFVAQPPYLLFYADKNRDDIPDGDPEVLLKGFGMEDAHAFANSLQWGPDGWLYGAHGSTSYANIRGIEFVQGIWRYHPITKEFELFSEGGGNTWGLDFDRQGNAIAGTNFGGFAMLHQMQGAFYIKNFVKHGELKNPHAYGYFDHVPYKGFKGGHVTCGGIVYQGGAFPESFENQYIACNLLANSIYWHAMQKDRSTYRARFGGDLLVANDPWFRPIDCLTGPDGAVYIVDWYDKRASHLDPRDNWDRSNGRIYKLQPRGLNAPGPLNLSEKSSAELVQLLAHKNDWYRREARRILAERRDASVIPQLRKLALEEQGELALQALWALYVSGGFSDTVAKNFLQHPTEEVRTWTIRLLGDAKHVTRAQAQQMINLAREDRSPLVRSQLACTARRLPGRDGLSICAELMRRDEDADDPFIPLLIWWAIEAHALSDRQQVLDLFDGSATWHKPIVQRFLIERIARRYMAEGNERGYRACAWLLERAPDAAQLQRVLEGMVLAVQGSPLPGVPAALRELLSRLRREQPDNLALLRLAVLVSDAQAYKDALARLANDATPERNRAMLATLLGQTAREDGLAVLVKLFTEARSNSLRRSALAALQSYGEDAATQAILGHYTKLPADLRSLARSILCSREASALQLVKAIDTSAIGKDELSLNEVRQLSQFKNQTLLQLIEKHWGKVTPITLDEKLSRINHFNAVLSRGRGDASRGYALFKEHCATCHTLFGEGNAVGPDLTAADRKDRNFLLTHIVDPNAVQRLEYACYVVVTTDGRSLTGVIKDASPQAITLVNAKNEQTTLPRAQIEELTASPVSLMPERLLDPFDDGQLRDLFAYLQSPQPLNEAGKNIQPVKKGELLRICLVSGSLEYQSDESLAKLQKYLENNYNIKCTRAFRKTDTDLAGLENLKSCDVAIFFTRRLTPPEEQLRLVKDFCNTGKPIVALRTASHGFQNWLEFDKLVLGGDYKGHFGVGPMCDVEIVPEKKDHPVLKGVSSFQSPGSLYKNPKIGKDTTVLLTGSIPDQPTQPIAWTRMHRGGRVFYTSLGHPRDFDNENFVRMIVNAVYWVAGRDLPE